MTVPVAFDLASENLATQHQLDITTQVGVDGSDERLTLFGEAAGAMASVGTALPVAEAAPLTVPRSQKAVTVVVHVPGAQVGAHVVACVMHQ